MISGLQDCLAEWLYQKHEKENQMSKHPKCRELGLKIAQFSPVEIRNHCQTPWKDYISADELEAVLEKGQVVYGEDHAKGCYWWRQDQQAGVCKTTHTALLLNVKPIQQVTAESLLREIVLESAFKNFIPISELDKARRFLGMIK